jgi:hypothetical protein
MDVLSGRYDVKMNIMFHCMVVQWLSPFGGGGFGLGVPVVS